MDKWDVKCAKMDNLGELFSISSRCLCIVDLYNLRMFNFGPFSFDILLHFYAINTSMLFETKCKPKECVGISNYLWWLQYWRDYKEEF